MTACVWGAKDETDRFPSWSGGYHSANDGRILLSWLGASVARWTRISWWTIFTKLFKKKHIDVQSRLRNAWLNARVEYSVMKWTWAVFCSTVLSRLSQVYSGHISWPSNSYAGLFGVELSRPIDILIMTPLSNNTHRCLANVLDGWPGRNVGPETWVANSFVDVTNCGPIAVTNCLVRKEILFRDVFVIGKGLEKLLHSNGL